MKATALLGLAHQADRRASRRHPSFTEAKIISPEIWCELDCVIRNRSEHGAKLFVPLAAQLPSEFALAIRSENRTLSARLIWRRGAWAGIEFRDKPASDSVNRRK